MQKKIVVIGGSAAGPKAAAKARRMDENAKVTLVQKGSYLSMASCGYPYYVGGTFDDRSMLLATPSGVVRCPKYYLAAKNIDAITETEAISISPEKKQVLCKNVVTGVESTLDYDSLIIATGAVPFKPPVPGIDLEGITTLQSMEDADFLRKIRDEKKIKKAIIIGGGLIGIETCEALTLAGIETTVIERLPQLLTFLDEEIALLVEKHIRAKGVNVLTGNGLSSFLGKDGKLTGVKLDNGTELPCEIAIMAVGVRPNSALAKSAGLKIGVTGGVLVDECMTTSDPNIFAVGDCVETTHRITGKPTHAPFGDIANLQGRVAGRNAIEGCTQKFPGTFQTGICKIFDYSAGTTGLNERGAKAEGLDYITVVNASPDKPGFMKGKLLVSKMVASKKDGKILGVQCVGPGDVSRQISTWAMALLGKLTIYDMANADLPYAPPFSLAIDHSIATAHIMQNKLEGKLDGIPCTEVRRMFAEKIPFTFLDVREPDEYEQMRLGKGEILMPLGALRSRLSELPQDKDALIVCFCKISLRGYEASLVLKANGWKNVKVMEGGILACPFEKEKSAMLHH